MLSTDLRSCLCFSFSISSRISLYYSIFLTLRIITLECSSPGISPFICLFPFLAFFGYRHNICKHPGICLAALHIIPQNTLQKLYIGNIENLLLYKAFGIFYCQGANKARVFRYNGIYRSIITVLL